MATRAGRDPAEGSGELAELLGLARRLRCLRAEEWPDPAFLERLVAQLAGRQLGSGWRPWSSWRSAGGLALATAGAALVVALGLFLVLGRTSSVSAAVLASRAVNASSGVGLPPGRFTQIVTNELMPGSFEPAPRRRASSSGSRLPPPIVGELR